MSSTVAASPVGTSRIPLAIIYSAGGLEGAYQLLIGPPWTPPATVEASSFMMALATGFSALWILVKLLQAMGALLLWIPKTAPLGALLVLPISTVIITFQLALNMPSGAPVAAVIIFAQTWPLWVYRANYRRIIEPPMTAARASRKIN